MTTVEKLFAGIGAVLLTAGAFGADIYLAGDSTMRDYNNGKMAGWGQMLREFTKPEVRVFNHAQSGRSSKSFIAEKRWEKLVSLLVPGDFVVIQFGHNDQKTERDCYAAAGEYKDNLRMFIRQVREKKANPILATSIVRRTFNESGVLEDSLNLREYAESTLLVGKELDVPTVDLNMLTRILVEQLGDEKSRLLYFVWFNRKDNTHTTPTGAKQFAELFVNDVKRRNLPIAELFK